MNRDRIMNLILASALLGACLACAVIGAEQRAQAAQLREAQGHILDLLPLAQGDVWQLQAAGLIVDEEQDVLDSARAWLADAGLEESP
jgi:hypothetical protein